MWDLVLIYCGYLGIKNETIPYQPQVSFFNGTYVPFPVVNSYDNDVILVGMNK